MAKKKTNNDDYFAFASAGNGKAKVSNKPQAKKPTGKKPEAKKPAPAKNTKAKNTKDKEAKKPVPAKKPSKPAFNPKPVNKMLTEKQFRSRLDKNNRIDAVVKIELSDLMGDVEFVNDFVDDLLVPEKSIAGLSDIQYKVFGADTKKNAVLLRVNANASDVLDSLDNKPTAKPAPEPAPEPEPEPEPEPQENTVCTNANVESDGEPTSDILCDTPMDKIRPDADGRFVPAKVASLDGEMVRCFDALPFLRDADEEDIMIVAGQRWGEDESAQRVADFCFEQNPSLQDVYDYNSDFTVTLDGERAMMWLRQHRSPLAFRIKQSFPDIVGSNT